MASGQHSTGQVTIGIVVAAEQQRAQPIGDGPRPARPGPSTPSPVSGGGNGRSYMRMDRGDPVITSGNPKPSVA
jgi:hypothetical protein